MIKYRSFSIPPLLLVFFLLTNCCTTKTDAVNKSNVLNHVVSLSPGSAKVSCNITEILDDGSNYLFKLKILQVHGYGSSTTPISVGSTINANLTSDLNSTSEQKEIYREYLSSLKKIGVLLKEQKNKRLGSDSASNWLIVAISDN